MNISKRGTHEESWELEISSPWAYPSPFYVHQVFLPMLVLLLPHQCPLLSIGSFPLPPAPADFSILLLHSSDWNLDQS